DPARGPDPSRTDHDAADRADLRHAAGGENARPAGGPDPVVGPALHALRDERPGTVAPAAVGTGRSAGGHGRLRRADDLDRRARLPRRGPVRRPAELERTDRGAAPRRLTPAGAAVQIDGHERAGGSDAN